MNAADDKAIRDVMQKLLHFSFCDHLGIRDVMFDPATGVVAMIGPALTLERRLFPLGDEEGHAGYVNNYKHHLDREWARMFDIPQEIRPDGWPSPVWFGGDDYDIHISDFLQSLGHAVAEAFIASGAEDADGESFSCTITPEPGYPYSPGKTKQLYSARAKKWVTPPKPPYMTTAMDTTENKKEYAVDWCALAPVVCNQSGAMAANLDNIPMLLTHCIDLAGRKELVEREKGMSKCPGLLFPSLAAGMIPATNFGETVLVVDPAVAISAMKPYRRKGVWSAVTYSSDTWTETAGGMVSNIAIETWEQLHSVPNWAYMDHFYILGPKVKETGFHDEAVKPITSTAKLASSMKRKFKLWERDMTEERFAQLSDLDTGDRYGYLETKVNGVVGWDCIPLAAVPENLVERTRPMLKAIGFKGRILPVEVPREVAWAVDPEKNMDPYSMSWLSPEKRDWRLYQWAWLAAEAILWEAGQRSKVLQVELA